MAGFDDRFGAAPAPSGPPAPSGSPMAGPMSQPYAGPMSQPYPGSGGQQAFGAPVFGAPAQPGQTWASQPYQPTRRKAWGSQQVVTAVLVGIVALAALGFGWRYWQNHRAINAPATLGGLAQNHDPAVEQAMTTARAGLKQADHGHKAVVVAYGTVTGSDVAILVGVRGRLVSIEKDLNSGGIAAGAHQQIGHNTCAAFPGGFVCERTSAHLTEGVISQSKTRTMTQVSAMLDEAWSKA
jgi:hypothetical protein